MGPTRKRSGCVKFGCASLAILLAVFVGWVVILFGAAFIGSRTESVASRELRREIDRPLPKEQADASYGSERLLILDFSVGNFMILPGEIGEPFRVEAEFDTNAYALEDRFESGDGRGWTYRVTFRETGLIRDGGLRVLFGASYPELRVFIPPDVPIALRGRFGKGGADLELGGLWLNEIDLELEKGALDVNVGRPLIAPARSFRVHGKQGGMSSSLIGNASPVKVDIYWQQGGSSVDLRGQWVNDSDVSVRSRMGGNHIRLPHGVRIVGLPGRPLAPPTDDEIPLPTLRMTTSTAMGGQQITN